MKSFRIFFTVLTLLVLSQSTLAQYEYIFKTPFPKQIHLVDSICINLGKVDSQTLYNEIAKLRTAAANTDDYTRLNLGRAILDFNFFSIVSLLFPVMHIPFSAFVKSSLILADSFIS